MGGNGMHHLLDKLRPLVGLKSWDYCVIWKLSEDQSCIQWFGCCCGGVDDSAQNLGEELLFPVSTLLSCKDVMVMHSWTKCCDLLAQFPSSISLDSGYISLTYSESVFIFNENKPKCVFIFLIFFFRIYAQTMLSSHPRWLNLPDSPNSTSLHETVGTRVLIPVFGGLVEFFLGKQVAEDPQLIEFVMAQCNVPWDQEAMHNTQMNEFHMNDNAMVDYDSKLNTSNGLDLKIQSNLWASPASTSMDNFSLPWEVSLDQTRLSNSPANFFNELGQQFPSTSENRFKNEVGGFEGSTESIVSDRLTTAFNSPMEQIQFPEFVPLHESLMNNNNTSLHPSIDSCVTKQPVSEKDSIKQESGRADSGSDCSDQAEDDDHKGTGRGGKKHQSKNLVAERKRRKKLNDMLYALRALVPKITKMDRASILGDAIEFVKELEKQVKELQNELGEPVDINGDKNTHYNHDKNGISPGSKSEQDESLEGLKTGINGQGTRCSSNGKIAIPAKQAQDLTTPEEKMPQMEPQVEVTKIDEKEFFLKVFCEHKPGGFVRLMEAMNTLGLEITNANVFRVETLVMNVFKVQKRDNEMVQADYLRESLLGVTRNSIGGWSEPFLVPENGSKCGL